MKKTICSILVASIFLISSAQGAAPVNNSAGSEALNTAGKKGKIIAKSALYGFGGGLVVGLASQVFKRETKNIFLFGSLGLYAGIALGLYVISSNTGPRPYEGPDTYEDFSQLAPEKKASESLLLAEKPKNSLELKMVNLSF